MIVSFGLAIAGVMAYEQFLERRLQYPEQVISDLGLRQPNDYKDTWRSCGRRVS